MATTASSRRARRPDAVAPAGPRRPPDPVSGSSSTRSSSASPLAILIPIVYAVLGGFKTNGQLAPNPGPDPAGPVGVRELQRRAGRQVRADLLGRAAQQPRDRRRSPSSLDGAVRLAGGVRLRPDRVPGPRGACTRCSCSACCSRRRSRSCRCTSWCASSGLTGNPLGVALPQAAFALPLTIVILRPFFRSIPAELEDAARIDGCSSFGFFWRVLLPLARPALATVSVLAVVGDVERVPAAADHPQRRGPVDAAAGRHELLDPVRLGRGAGPRVHGGRADPGDRVLPVRRAAARRRPDVRGGEGLMTTIAGALPRRRACRSTCASPTCSRG